MSTVNSVLGASTTTGTSKSVGDMTSNDFLQLLITQLSNQDPSQPMTNQDLLQQLSAIRSLQSNTDLSTTISSLGASMTNMTGSMQNVSNGQQFATAMAMIGQVVTGVATDGTTVEGKVDSVNLSSKGLLLQIGAHQMNPNYVTKVGVANASA